MEKEQAKQRISDLVAKYNEIVSGKREKNYSEEDTIKDLILPLFEALGWDTYDKNEVSAQDHIKGSGRPDYNFRINGITQFYLEAKKLSVDLDDPDFAKQAIKYSWNKGVTYAILTNFRGIKVFNAQRIEKTSLMDKMVFEIPFDKYLDDLETLWLLSKESLKNKELDAFAEKHGKKERSVQVSTVIKKLNEDIQWCRERLTESFRICNKEKNIPKDLLDEGVQKLLDRLIFLRVAEDREVEPNILKNLLREAKNTPGHTPFEAMTAKFRELDIDYDSDLFTSHTFEKWIIWDGGLEEVVKKLYGKIGYYEYNFRDMPADVLGTVYENYLNYKLSQSKKGIDVKKDVKKRKEQGIYYTPPFVVDYIVKNALRPVLDNCHNIGDLKKIKVLDPACGSGSFLVKAMETIAERYRELGTDNEFIKRQILLENIFGVDLDKQAVEIARLNLLINSLDEKALLPKLDKNIKNGNSLISEQFNWQEEFPEVFAQGGFDVIIGNPPYGAELSKEDQGYFKKTYNIGSTDTAILFIKKSIELLRTKGYLGFIFPKAFTFASNYEKIRNFVWDNVQIIIDCSKVWKEVKLEQVVAIMQKDIVTQSYESGIADEPEIKMVGKINKNLSKQFGFFLNSVSGQEITIAQKMLRDSISLNDIANNQRGAMLQKEIGETGELEVLGGAQISREGINGIKGKINKDSIDDEKAYIKNNSVLVQNIVAHIENPVGHIKITAIIPTEKEKYVILDTVNQLVVRKEYSSYLICAILNSALINWFAYRFIFGKAIRTMHFDNSVTEKIPIPKTTEGQQKRVVSLVNKMLSLNKELHETPEHSDKWGSIKTEIERTDKKIDGEVYKIYGLTWEEIRIIENPL